jgi:hypothetical protein
MTGLYACRLPKSSSTWPALRRVAFKSVATNTLVEYQLPEWEVEVLRRSDGKISLGELLQKIPLDIPQATFGEQLFILRQLLAIQLRPSTQPLYGGSGGHLKSIALPPFGFFPAFRSLTLSVGFFPFFSAVFFFGMSFTSSLAPV